MHIREFLYCLKAAVFFADCFRQFLSGGFRREVIGGAAADAVAAVCRSSSRQRAGARQQKNRIRIGWVSGKKFPPVRLDAHSSIQTTSAFAKLALARACVCIRSRVLLIWKWIATAQMEKFLRTMKLFGHPQYLICQKGTKEVKGFADFF